MSIDMSQFYQVFFDEAEELLAEMEKLLLAVNIAEPDSEDLNAIFRTAHSIKGGASTFGITDMSDVTHFLESLLDNIRKGEMAITSEHVDAFLVAKDILKMQLNGHKFGAEVDQEAVADVRMMLQSLAQHSVTKIAPPPKVEKAVPKNSKEQYKKCYRVEFPKVSETDLETLGEELSLLGDISKEALDDHRFAFVLNTNAVPDDIIAICSFILDPEDLFITEIAIANIPPREANEDELGYGFFDPIEKPGDEQPDEEKLGYGFFEPIDPAFALDRTPGELMKGLPAKSENKSDKAEHAQLNGSAEHHTATKKDGDKAAGNQESTTIRVGIEKVDQLINLIGELVITQAMLEQRTATLDPLEHERLLSSIGQLTRNTRDLQEAVMSIRMMPMDYVFSRFPRMVRDLASKLGKKVEFVTYGASTELDKGLIERIVDPLTHLVRNSIDHGIEMPQVRLAEGKYEAGKLSLSASHQGGNIVIEVSDDGGGLNRDRIIAKAREQGLVAPDNMPDADVWQLIFAPGFSTAEVVTDVSGRGVGMDVVKRNITNMGGVVDIRSAKGFGTTIVISLPLTLAILDGMSIRVGEEVYILPLGYVVESLQPVADDIKVISGKGTVVKVRNEYLPLIALHQLFEIKAKYTDPCQGILVILEVDGKQAALFIDELVGQQQVVVKNIESNYKKIPSVSGATILGDGCVALILDVSALLRTTR
ncbi:chemotaxis protein CheA [Solimicrobium silvestre]|uniref:Chemotaxis protein CheA n=1 Tax=Solimicrobium silvestre TaxID=2099400 RepID=A0A2S9GZ06_9BURK|nr:chemotaxis protein CheA [Solimicrobium silvestre]PRC92969.1 Chemotaxis protein histidine kinase and related kinase [Solimicrobium silvestre]